MARRRKSGGTWFPTIGTAGLTAAGNVAAREFSLDVPIDGTVNTIISPLTYDTPAEPEDVDADAPGALAGMVGQEYMLRRLVGKLHFSNDSVGTPTGYPAALVGAGFFVARAADRGVGGGSDLPIGAASADERRENYSVLGEDTIREPWIWRRTWILGALTTSGTPGNFRAYQAVILAATAAARGITTTADYGSVLDGPHLDAKTMRRVTQDERLWFAVSAVGLPLASTVEVTGEINGIIDLRIFAQLRKARNRGVF